MTKISINLSVLVLVALVSLSCVKTKEKSSELNNGQEYLALGKTLASSTQAVLGKNLMQAMSNGGPEQALEFCNIKAIPLTDSMARELKTSLKRVSDQTRNPENKANKFEMEVIASQKKQIENGQTPEPFIREAKGKVIAYYPIVTNGLCLTCHGKVNRGIAAPTYAKIKELYPNDKAIGYEANQIRGLWVVEMIKNSL